MEDRKKLIRELEARKVQTQEALDGLLEKLGESFITRIESGEITPDMPVSDTADSPQGLCDEKARNLKEIAGSQETIKAIEANLSRLGELEELIDRKEQENSEKVREIAHLYSKLGEFILGDPRFREFCAPFEAEFNDITLRIDFQEKKLDELENSEGGFFIKVANGAKSMVTKSLLAKYRSTLEKLYRSAGEQFIVTLGKPSENLDELSGDEELDELIEQCEELRKLSATLKEEIAKLRNERKECADVLDQGGSPTRRISDIEKYIARIREDIRKIHRRFGTSIRRKEVISVFAVDFTDGEKALDEKICSLEELIFETDRRIEETKIAIAIDEKKAEIDKLKDVITEKRRVIADANAAIQDYDGKIAEAEKQLEELQEQHGQLK
ncbi:MAG: hypothetical protein LBI14_06520 [Treponema sp.]|nr:hypothetical protein [Treponema sp.]